MATKVKLRDIYVQSEKGNLEKRKVEYGVVFGAVEDRMLVDVVGESTFEQMNNLIYTGLYHLCESGVKNFGEKNRKQIYERSVQLFSLLMDKFYPEGKETRFGVLTDEDIKEAEDKKIDLLSKQK